MLTALINTYFLQCFHEAERIRTGIADWSPPEQDEPGFQEYMNRKESAWLVWQSRSNYPLLSEKDISLPEEMYPLLTRIREARQSEINKSRTPAIQTDLFLSAVRCLGDYLIRHDIAGYVIPESKRRTS